jgi:hypothetical protein
VLVFCLSAQAFGSDWAQLQDGTFRFRDPLNPERRFIPLRLDDAPIEGSLAQFLYINWRPADREQEYAKLLEFSPAPAKSETTKLNGTPDHAAEKAASVRAYGLGPDRGRILFSSNASRKLTLCRDFTTRKPRKS